MNRTVQLEFEPYLLQGPVQYFNHYTMGTPPYKLLLLGVVICIKYSYDMFGKLEVIIVHKW